MSILLRIAVGAIPVAKWLASRHAVGHQIRPVITVGVEAMDKIFASEQ